MSILRGLCIWNVWRHFEFVSGNFVFLYLSNPFLATTSFGGIWTVLDTVRLYLINIAITAGLQGALSEASQTPGLTTMEGTATDGTPPTQVLPHVYLSGATSALQDMIQSNAFSHIVVRFGYGCASLEVVCRC